MSIFLSGGGVRCEAGVAVREDGWGGLCGAMDMGLCSLFFIFETIRENFFAAHSLFWVYS